MEALLCALEANTTLCRVVLHCERCIFLSVGPFGPGRVALTPDFGCRTAMQTAAMDVLHETAPERRRRVRCAQLQPQISQHFVEGLGGGDD